MSQIITKADLLHLLQQTLNAGTRIAGPVSGPNGRAFFRYLTDIGSLILDPALKPVNSIKEFFFPRHENIYQYQQQGKDMVVTDVKPFSTSQIIIAARPCDAASLPILDKVFAWDYQDRFYQSRREHSTIITLACSEGDNDCFCSSVGLSPQMTEGSDALLLAISEELFEVRPITDKGRHFFANQTKESTETGKSAELPAKKFDMETVGKYLAEHFDDPVFEQAGLRCLGCGACTYLCPTCHCFELVDEGGTRQGNRVKNWDSCQFALFTFHASGHNPRSQQGQRQRNRIQHKFNIYPEKFGMILCTGCGNCTRGCGISSGVWPILKTLDEKK